MTAVWRASVFKIHANDSSYTGGNLFCRCGDVSFLEARIIPANHATIFAGPTIIGADKRRGGNCRRYRLVDCSFSARRRLGIDLALDCRFPGEHLYDATSGAISPGALDLVGASAAARCVHRLGLVRSHPAFAEFAVPTG